MTKYFLNSLIKASRKYLMKLETAHTAPNYKPSLPIVIKKSLDTRVYDTDNKPFYDFLSAYSAVNQGHLHPKIIEAAVEQMKFCTLPSRAYYNDIFPLYAQKITKLMGFDHVIPMNTGAEAVETACKLARRWGYRIKHIPPQQAHIVSIKGCFHGRTLFPISFSNDPDCQDDFGPFAQNIIKVEFNNLDQVRKIFEQKGKNICSIIIEPIQGEAGVKIPSPGYLKSLQKLCNKHNILLIADEIQTGLGRTGKMLACDWEDVKPDILILGKALGAGIYPVSAVLANKHISEVLVHGSHGSTFGGNPLACKVATTSLDVLLDEGLIDNANCLGNIFRCKIKEANIPAIKEIRGKGLLNAIELVSPCDTSQIVSDLAFKDGIMTKAIDSKTIRFSPPLTFKKEEFKDCVDLIIKRLKSIEIK